MRSHRCCGVSSAHVENTYCIYQRKRCQEGCETRRAARLAPEAAGNILVEVRES